MTGENAHMLYLLLQSVNILGSWGTANITLTNKRLVSKSFYVPPPTTSKIILLQ